MHEPLLKDVANADTALAVDEATVGRSSGKEKATTTMSKRRKGRGTAVPETEIIDLTGDDSSSVNNLNIFTCHSCGASACVPCDRPYHDGESCAQYRKRRKRQDETEEVASQKLIEKECKKCPKCEKNIQRSMGCDYMTCEFSQGPGTCFAQPGLLRRCSCRKFTVENKFPML